MKAPGVQENATPETMILNQNSIEIEENVIQLLQNKQGVDYQNDVDVLMYESNAAGGSQAQQTTTSYGFNFVPSRFNIVNRMTG